MSYLTDRGLSADLASYNGWYVSEHVGDGRTRIVIPATNTVGYVYYQARAVDSDAEPRYMSPKYAAGDSVVVVWPMISTNRVVLVEGPMDALAAAEHRAVGVALMGKRVRKDAFAQIAGMFRGYTFITVPDSDGLSVAADWGLELAKHGLFAYMTLTGHKDLASTPRELRGRLLGY